MHTADKQKSRFECVNFVAFTPDRNRSAQKLNFSLQLFSPVRSCENINYSFRFVRCPLFVLTSNCISLSCRHCKEFHSKILEPEADLLENTKSGHVQRAMAPTQISPISAFRGTQASSLYGLSDAQSLSPTSTFAEASAFPYFYSLPDNESTVGVVQVIINKWKIHCRNLHTFAFDSYFDSLHFRFEPFVSFVLKALKKLNRSLCEPLQTSSIFSQWVTIASISLLIFSFAASTIEHSSADHKL